MAWLWFVISYYAMGKYIKEKTAVHIHQAAGPSKHLQILVVTSTELVEIEIKYQYPKLWSVLK